MVYTQKMRIRGSWKVAPLVLIGSLYGLAPLALTFSLASGCASQEVNEQDPASLMADAEADIESSHYQIALDKLRMIKSRFPYSKQAVDAQLRIADVYFMQDSFGEAALAYESFRDLHPNHEKTSYAMNRAALSYYKDIPSTVARDLAPARRSLEAYEAFLGRYPDSAEAPEARTRIAEIRDLLAQKELYVANFYFKRKFFRSARRRFEKVLELFGDTRTSETAKAQLALCDAQIQAGQSKEEEEREERARKEGASGLSSPLKGPSIFGPSGTKRSHGLIKPV